MHSHQRQPRSSYLLQSRLLWLVGVSSIITACGPAHIEPFTPRQRNYKLGEYAQTSAKPSSGSLFSDAMGGFLEDTRALRVGDVVVVRIDESADAEGGAGTNLSHDSSAQMGSGAILGLMPALKKAHPNIDPEKLIEYASLANFNGQGTTQRKGQLSGSIAVRVAKEMPNGDLFLEGTKVILINNEEYHLYISGLVRPTDIAQDNSVESSRIADAQFEFTGNGVVQDTIEQGWLTKLLSWVNPF